MKLGYENNHNIPCEENISIWKFEPWKKKDGNKIRSFVLV